MSDDYSIALFFMTQNNLPSFSGLKSLVGSKTLEEEDILPVMEKMKDHLIGKNVAADISDKLCASVATKLEGKVLGTFNTVASTVKTGLNEACMQILRPRRRVDILRDAMTARDARRPYVITFCGVNGVGKSTNLAKVGCLVRVKMCSGIHNVLSFEKV